MQSKIAVCGEFLGSQNDQTVVPKRWLRIAGTLAVIASLSILSHPAVAQTTSSVLNPNQGFTLVGPIQNFRLTTPGNVLSGGTITVNGVTVKIPANIVVTMPTSFLTAN